jgi:hypothetical protein
MTLRYPKLALKPHFCRKLLKVPVSDGWRVTGDAEVNFPIADNPRMTWQMPVNGLPFLETDHK